MVVSTRFVVRVGIATVVIVRFAGSAVVVVVERVVVEVVVATGPASVPQRRTHDQAGEQQTPGTTAISHHQLQCQAKGFLVSGAGLLRTGGVRLLEPRNLAAHSARRRAWTARW